MLDIVCGFMLLPTCESGYLCGCLQNVDSTKNVSYIFILNSGP